jgi:hypothetical protein
LEIVKKTRLIHSFSGTTPPEYTQYIVLDLKLDHTL